MPDLGFEQTLTLLHGWLGQELSVWVNVRGDSLAYMRGLLSAGDSLPARYGEDTAATAAEALFF